MLTKEEIEEFFKKLGLATEEERKKMLLQGVVESKEEQKPTCQYSADDVTTTKDKRKS